MRDVLRSAQRPIARALSRRRFFRSLRADDHFVVTGYTTSFATAGDDPYLIKLDALGEESWTRVLPIDGVQLPRPR